MPNFYADNDDLRFYVEKYVDWEKLVDLVELHFKAADAPKDYQEALATYTDVFNLVGEFVANEVAPRAKLMDTVHPHLDTDGRVQMGKEHDAIFAGLKELGVYGMNIPRELGGMNLPLLVYFMVAEVFARADVGCMTHFAFHVAGATAMVEYSVREGSATIDECGRVTATRWDPYLSEILAGEAWGSMDLTEAGAGSDLAALRSRAVKDANGVWRLTGNKIFITSGHAKYHMVLAKTADKNSLDALSLFVVPMTIERDGQTIVNARVDRIEEKIGHHSSATCSVQYDNSEADLVGKEGDGFKNMLMMMNGARIGVGFEGIGVMEAALRMAKAYAAERKSMGKTLDHHEMIADALDDMETTILGVRALAVEAAIKEESATRSAHLQKYAHTLNTPEAEKDVRRCRRKARLYTPLLKYVSAESAVRLTRMAMQIHGGNGYMKDYEIERLLRDSLVLPIYEGTSQIQSLMVLKDHLGAAIKKPQVFFQKLAQAKLNAVKSLDSLDRGYWSLRSLAYSAQQQILISIAKDKWSSAKNEPLPKILNALLKNWDPKHDFSFGLLHAEHLTALLADVEIADILVRQAKRFPERRVVAERWIERAQPRVRNNWDLIVNSSGRIVNQVRHTVGGEPG